MNDNPGETKAKILGELQAGRISGPYSTPPFEVFKSCPLALRPKPNGKFRLLHNLSYPFNEDSVNGMIPESCAKVSYASIADAINLIKKDPGCFLAKCDIADAFRLVPISPLDYHLLGFSFEGEYYFDRCLPMGCRSACNIFEKVSDGLVFILKERFGVVKVVKYLDDFLFVGKNRECCARSLRTFQALCKELGIPLAEHKTEGPTRALDFLGYHLDTRAMIVSIPKEKIDDYSLCVWQMMEAKVTTLRELRSIIGKLLFVTNIIRGGKCFLRRLINLTIGKHHPAQRITLSSETLEDLKLWQKFLLQYNGESLICKKSFHFFEALSFLYGLVPFRFCWDISRGFHTGTLPEFMEKI